MRAKAKDLLTFSTKMDNAFITVGFDNWKKAPSRFKEHESSGTHNEALMKIAHLKSKEPDVHSQLNTKKQKEQNSNRYTFITEISCICVLARQGLALRGHVEEEGNSHQLMKARAEDDKNIVKWLDNGTYMSHDSVNEIVKIMGHSILRKLIAEIHEAG